ncbi:hypothetical protein [Anabaena sphaerica]|nr:hypothetical protein [Anabaena sphaerica]
MQFSSSQNTAGVRSQESGVKLALCIGFNLDSVPYGYATQAIG